MTNQTLEDTEVVKLPGSEDAETPKDETPEEEGADTPEEGDEPESNEPKQPEEPEGEDEEKGNDGEEGKEKEPAPVLGETAKERAMRLEIIKLRGLHRKEMKGDIKLSNGIPSAPAKTELPAEDIEVLKGFKPEEVDALRKVFPILAKEQGYVRSGELTAQKYEEQADEELNKFLDKHPEYTPENDKDGLLWKQFAEEFGMYNKPQNPRDFAKIFNRVHSAIFNIKPIGDKGHINAQNEKIKVASHAGASGPTRSGTPSHARPVSKEGLRLDMLKGFDDEELDAMTGGD